MAREALDHAVAVGSGYSNLEYDLDAGRRGSRQDIVSELLFNLSYNIIGNLILVLLRWTKIRSLVIAYL